MSDDVTSRKKQNIMLKIIGTRMTMCPLKENNTVEVNYV